MKSIIRRPVQLWLLVITAVILAACQPLGLLNLPQLEKPTPQSAPSQNGAVPPALPPAEIQSDLTVLFQQVNPGVVSIQTITDQGGRPGFGICL